MKYVAIYCPIVEEGEENPTTGDFSSEESAWEWIAKNHLCPSCQKVMEEGGGWCYRIRNGILDKNDGRWFPVDHVSLTSCGAEWTVLTEEEWDTAEHDVGQALLNTSEECPDVIIDIDNILASPSLIGENNE